MGFLLFTKHKVKQNLSKDKIIDEFNFGKYSFEDSAKSLLTIDVTCAGKYKPIVDPSIRITVHTLLNIIGEGGSYIARPSAELETAHCRHRGFFEGNGLAGRLISHLDLRFIHKIQTLCELTAYYCQTILISPNPIPVR